MISYIRRSGAILLAASLLLTLCACSGVGGSAESVTYSVPEEIVQQFEDEVDAEVLAAIQEGKTALLWRIAPTAEIVGTAALWQYTPLNCSDLWDAIREAVFPGAALLSDEMLEDVVERRITLSHNENTYTVRLIGDGNITVSCASPEDALRRAEQLVALLEEMSGFVLTSVEPETEELAKYAYVVDGICVDTKLYATTLGACVCVQDTGDIVIDYPIALGDKGEQTDLAQYLTMEQARRICRLQWNYFNLPQIGTIDDYALFYIIDVGNGRLRPAWRFTGMLYDFSSGNAQPMDMVIDGETGAVIRFG
ncbi:MAG: hypothetical protein LBM28_05325 [Oscillospiraceae bacterium]|jgi:hypothetical protein|nr:hypothetical protein [Oscillospiraceae bacterium]